MNEPSPGGFSPADADADAPTPEQEAALQYLGLASAGSTTRAQAGALIARAEADPASQETLRAWHREKLRLHPALFAPPQRSFREARWWQSKISAETLNGYSFQQPSLDQTFVILDALDRQEPGWDQESGPRRETRFMNELATLSPELCKPGCVFPHDLPEDGAPGETPAAVAPANTPFVAPSAPFVPGQYAAQPLPFKAPSAPAWQPPVQPPAPTLLPAHDASGEALARGGGGAWKWGVLALVLLAAGGGAYSFFGLHTPSLERGAAARRSSAAASPGNAAAPAAPPATLAANASRQRAIARYPDLAQAGTALNAKFVVTFRDLEAAHDPLLQQPDWPERLADRCAQILASSKPGTSKSTHAPTPAPSLTAVTPPTPAPAVQNTVAPSIQPVSAPSAAAPAAMPLPPEKMFVTLEASYKDKLNTVKYRQHGAAQEAGVAVDVHSMMRVGAKLTLRCVFFKRPNGRGDLRTVLSSSEKHIDLAAGQTYSDAFDSPPVYRGRGATEEFDGWLVQLIPEGSNQFLKQIGSTGTIEELGKRMKF